MKLFCKGLLGLVFALALGAQAQSTHESRLALLIGNASYKNSPLQNPVNDVRLMDAALKEAGFKVTKAENVSRREMQRLIRDFGERLKQSGGVGLFYFAGHGLQVKGANYLVPVDADIRAEDEVAYDSVDAQSVLEKMESAKNRMNLLILDACRDNPFAKNSRSSASGLATMNAPSGSLVAYATAPGSVASDGNGKNGLYTQHLAAAIRAPDLPIEEVFKRVRANVRKDSANQQTPWENTALEGNFYFNITINNNAPPTAAAQAASVAAAPNPLAVELAYWDSIKTSNKASELQAYLDQYPTGTFASLAKTRLADLSKVAPKDNPAPLPMQAQPQIQQQPQQFAMLSPSGAQQRSTLNWGSKEIAEGQMVGNLVFENKITNRRNVTPIRVEQKNNAFTLFSTGDKIAADGQVLAVRLGELITVNEGALWKLPLQVGARGRAQVTIRGLQGELGWQVRQGVNADSYFVIADFRFGEQPAGRIAPSGIWTIEYRQQMLPWQTGFSRHDEARGRPPQLTTKLEP